jgi:RNA polymerase sigma factor (sigma-70 family)
MRESMRESIEDTTQRLLRELAPQVLGVTLRRFRDFAASEDAVQEALLAAATQWRRDGLPDNPRGWLLQIASRRIADHVRGEVARRRREAFVVSLVPADEQLALAADAEQQVERDDTLDLLFMCCHPQLSASSAIALTLRAVGGLTTLEIAKAFLVPEATMAQRISRAKQLIKSSALPIELPSTQDRAARLDAVMHVLYLIFNEGYTASSGPELARSDLSSEALRLTRMLYRLVPDDCEVAGLLALMLLTDARRAARTGSSGELIPLDQQDRTLWQRDAIARARRPVSGASGGRGSARRGRDRGRNRLAADSGPVRAVAAHVGQSAGPAQPCDRDCHGSWSGAWARATRSTGGRPTARWSSSARRGARASARACGRPRCGDRALSPRGGRHDQHGRA